MTTLNNIEFTSKSSEHIFRNRDFERMADEKEWHVFLKPVPKEKVFEVDIKGILDKFMHEGNAFKSQIAFLK